MNRAQKRADRQSFDRYLRHVSKHVDLTKPLHWAPDDDIDSWGWVHTYCGGAADRPNIVTGYCSKCQRTVPTDSLRRKRRDE